MSKDYCITCIKDGFYDSGLLIESHGEKVLNLNDCEVTTSNRADDVLSITGKVDVLLTQFSFAAWKGGKENKKWRDEAAKEKIKTVELQIQKFQPKITIPFASYVYFSNEENFYLNDAINKPNQLKDKIKEQSCILKIMAPNDIIGGKANSLNENLSLEFWEEKYQAIKSKQLNKYSKLDIKSLQVSFQNYVKRIRKNNNMILVKTLRTLSPISAFKPVIIHLKDLNVKIKFDYIDGIFIETIEPAMLSMSTESLDFIFKNSFGFDTLTVNGCFEEVEKGGFVKATKTLAIENLNNLGIRIEIKTLFNFSIIKLFLSALNRVSKKLDA